MIATGDAAVRDITTNEYAGFQRLIGDEAGISLGAGKRQLLVGRVARSIRERGLDSYGEYLEIVRADRTGQELVRLLDLVTTNETRFFRETPHYRYLADELCPAWRQSADAGRRSRQVRVWSAACSTGQEPYSVAMTLMDHLPAAEGWSIEVLASDLSTRVLAVATSGEYELAKADEIPAAYLRRFMLRGIGARAGWMSVSAEVRQAIRFFRVNLNEREYSVPGSFDLVFCSNALIYFSRTGQSAVVDRLTKRLAPDGRLFVGHAESLHDHRALLRTVAPTVYARVNSSH
ncbi:MAG: protein-glutamate O-methyltransferase CheR [bacterium]